MKELYKAIRKSIVNSLGGIDSTLPEELNRAKNADLITMPANIDGTSCINCKFFNDNYCTHPQVKQAVNERMCCALWDAEGTYRAFKK